MKIKVGDKKFSVEVAETDEDKVKGLSNRKELKSDNGMLFVYDDEEDLSFHMKDTHIPLDIAFLGEGGVVKEIKHGEPLNLDPIVGKGRYVLELNKDSGIQIGDVIDIEEEDIEKFAEGGKMSVLDENGNEQMEIEGGERIVSRAETKQLVIKAKKAKKEKTDAAYANLGKYIASVITKQDDRDPEYV